MVGKFRVLADTPDSYTSKRGTVVNSQVVTLIDVSPRSEDRLIQPLDYTMSPDEKTQYAGKLADKEIEIAIRELSMFGGRFRVRGRIVDVPGLNGAAVKK